MLSACTVVLSCLDLLQVCLWVTYRRDRLGASLPHVIYCMHTCSICHVHIFLVDINYDNNQLDSSAYGSMDEMDDMPQGNWLLTVHCFNRSLFKQL